MYNELLWVVLLVVSFTGIMLSYILFGLYGLYGWTGVAMIVANIQVMKLIPLLGLLTAIGNIVYATTFLCTDIISEIYGKRRSKIAVSIGLFAIIMSMILMSIVLKFKPAPQDRVQGALETIFGFYPRIVLASLTAYIFSQYHDVWAFHFWKDKTKGKFLWLRNNASTMVSQLIDSLIFATIAFVGVLPFSSVLIIMLTNYIFKWLVAASDTPFVYLARFLYKKGWTGLLVKNLNDENAI